MRHRLLLMLALAAWGCGQQSLTSGTGTGGAGASTGSGGTGGTGGCGPLETKLTCPGACSGTSAPICLGGVWTCQTYGLACPRCPEPIPQGCTCDIDTGFVMCEGIADAVDVDGSNIDGSESVGDAATGCPPMGQDAGFVSCVESCATDTGVGAVCVAGHWECPRGAFSPTMCTPCSLSPPPPPGCMCDPTNGVVSCDRDAGAAAPDRHGG